MKRKIMQTVFAGGANKKAYLGVVINGKVENVFVPKRIGVTPGQLMYGDVVIEEVEFTDAAGAAKKRFEVTSYLSRVNQAVAAKAELEYKNAIEALDLTEAEVSALWG